MWHGKLHHGTLKNMQGERKAMQQIWNDWPLGKSVQKKNRTIQTNEQQHLGE